MLHHPMRYSEQTFIRKTASPIVEVEQRGDRHANEFVDENSWCD